MKQQFKNKVEKVAGRDFHEHHYWSDEEPPDDPEVAIECPQCHCLTWRLTQHCRKCRIDLFKWREDERLMLVRKRLQYFGFGLAATAAMLMLVGYVIGSPVQLFANVGACLLGFAAVKTFDQACAT